MFPIKVIAIDNEKKELDLAVYGLSKALIPVVPILYDSIDGVSNSISEPLSGIRLVFCDLNLLDVSSASLEAKHIVGQLGEVLKSVISMNNGPYVLILWTKHVRLVKEIEHEFKSRDIKILPPIKIASIDKTLIPFTDDDTSIDDKSVSIFSERLNEIINEDLVMKFFSLWEEYCLLAAGDITSTFYKMANPELSWSNEYNESICSTLKGIAQDVVGEDNVVGREYTCITEIFSSLIQDYLYRKKNENLESSIKDIFQLASGGNKINYQSLNTFYHIVNDVSSSSERGSFSGINDDIDKYIYFDKNDVFEQFFKKSKYLSENSKRENKIEIEEIRNKSIIGFIEISPSCDYAQNKTRALRYVFSVLIPYEYVRAKLISSGGEHDGIHVFPEFMVNDELYSLRSNVRYVISLPDDDNFLRAPIFRLREQILNDLIHKFSSHASRPGIIKFS
ncbi:MAG: hypothetical protein E7A54_10630 [Morganella morganii]|nr:hypothetical protein [Morganella morganii]MDU1073825.1 hypothetical protein [Morganella morganii]